MPLKLTYFALPGRAEAARIILTLGKIPFEDHVVSGATWAEFKPTTPFGQVPLLTLEDGRILAQSVAIERYAGKLAGLYPKDDVTAAFADQWALFAQDLIQHFVPTFSIADLVAKSKARHDLCTTGPVADKLKVLDKALKGTTYLTGSELTWADISAFALLGMMTGGDWDGVPKTLLDDYPSIKAWFQRIASIDAIKAKYADATGTRTVFQAK